MMEEVQINHTSNDITKLHHKRNESNYIINPTSVEDTNASMENPNQSNWEVQMNRLTNELGSCGNIVQLPITRELELQKKILECESRLNSSKDVLVEEDTIFSNLEHELTYLDWAILESEKCLQVTHRQRHR
jgi:hypothetical protein